MKPILSRRSCVSARSLSERDLDAVDRDRAARRAVEAGEDVHEGRLARARRTHDGRVRSALQVDVDVVQRDARRRRPRRSGASRRGPAPQRPPGRPWPTGSSSRERWSLSDAGLRTGLIVVLRLVVHVVPFSLATLDGFGRAAPCGAARLFSVVSSRSLAHATSVLACSQERSCVVSRRAAEAAVRRPPPGLRGRPRAPRAPRAPRWEPADRATSAGTAGSRPARACAWPPGSGDAAPASCGGSMTAVAAVWSASTAVRASSGVAAGCGASAGM